MGVGVGGVGGGRGNQARFGKSKGQMAELRRALDSVYGAHSELFAYGSLFAEDREMNQNDFGEAFRDQAPPPPPLSRPFLSALAGRSYSRDLP